MSTIITSHPHPVLPLFTHLHEHGAHDRRAGHEAMPFTLEDTHFAAPHALAEPLDVVNGHPVILASVMNDDWPGYVDVAKANGVSALETDEQIDGGVGAGSGEIPNGVGEAGVVDDLALLVGGGGEARHGDASGIHAVLWGVHSVHVFGGVGRGNDAVGSIVGLNVGELGEVALRGRGIAAVSSTAAAVALALAPAGRLGQGAGDGGAGGAHEAAVGGFEKGCG